MLDYCYYCYYIHIHCYEPMVGQTLFICMHDVSVVVAHVVATSLIMRRDVIISLLYSPAIFDVIIIIIFYYL
jgi:hypothetical protein